MSTPNDTKPSSIDSAKKERLSLRRETLRMLGVRSGIKTGEPCTMDTQISCKLICTSAPPTKTVGYAP